LKYIIIPDEVFSSQVSDGAQRLYGLLFSLYRRNRIPVRSDNKWLAERLGKEERQIRRYLHYLTEHKFITTQFERFSKKSVRRLIIPLVSAGQKCPVDTISRI
jgi:hypothetical protein